MAATLRASSSLMMEDGLAAVMEVAASPGNGSKVEGLEGWLCMVENGELTSDGCIRMRRMEG